MPVIDGLPVPEPLRQIAPRAPSPGPEEDPVNYLPVIGPSATARRISGQEPPQAVPLLISQIMAIQQIKHRTDLHDPAVKIHRPRPSAAGRLRSDAVGPSPPAISLAGHAVEVGVGPDLPDLLRAAAGDGDLGSPLQRLLA